MLGFQLTPKNYRCFADSDPLRLDLGNDFTALVGPNNSGKSSALRLFHELRPVFSRHIRLFPSKDSVIEFSRKVEAEKLLNIRARVRPKTLVFLSQHHASKDVQLGTNSVVIWSTR